MTIVTCRVNNSYKLLQTVQGGPKSTPLYCMLFRNGVTHKKPQFSNGHFTVYVSCHTVIKCLCVSYFDQEYITL